MDKKIFSGRYRIEEKIGVGGMAEVYKAFDTTLDRTVAVKVLHPQFAAEQDFVARFRREAQAAANLNQPNIVNVYDWGGEDGNYYIVMEYLVGRNLKQIITEQGPLPSRVAIDIARQVAAALQFAHKNGIVHRDIKPHNIIITDEGEVKVTDFGIARSAASNVTQTGAILGTAQYISPEQAKGEDVGAATDIYSLGVVLYEMLTGKVPFNGDSPVAVALKQIQETPKRPSELNPDVPTDLEAITVKAIAKTPKDRYQSAAELRDDLGRAADGLPVQAGSSGFGDSDMTVVLPRPVRPNRRSEGKEGRRPGRIAAFILALILLFAASAWATSYFLGRMPTREVPAVTGETLQGAKKLAAKAKLKIEVSDRVFDEKTAAGRIIDQTPKAGEKLAAGGIISVIVSKGKDLVTVPDLTGKFQNDAMRTISNLGLRVDITRDFNDRVEEDYVISHDPAGSAEVAKGTYINLLVSRGPRPLKVPFLVGKTVEEARSTLASMGLVIQAREVNDDEVEAGRVISQDPAQGVAITKGDSVSVTVSKGPDQVTVPSVVGLGEESAKGQLQDAGFTVQVKQGVSGPGLYGKVVTQKPDGDSTARKGATVTIWVGAPPVGD